MASSRSEWRFSGRVRPASRSRRRSSRRRRARARGRALRARDSCSLSESSVRGNNSRLLHATPRGAHAESCGAVRAVAAFERRFHQRSWVGLGARPFVPRGRSSRARSSVGRAAGRGAGLNLRRNITEAQTKCRAALIRSAWRRASTTKGAGPHPCGAGAEWASLGDISPVERRCFRLHGGTAQLLSSCCMACLTWAWARGVPASWRSWRPLHEASTPMHIYARAHGDGVGDALPQDRRPHGLRSPGRGR